MFDIRPRVIVNCAMSADGKIALPSKKQLRISSDEDIARVHVLRNECDAILVGIKTVLSDNPKLTVKKRYLSDGDKKKTPVRVVLDSRCRTPRDALVVDDDAPTILMVGRECTDTYGFGETVDIVKCPLDEEGYLDLSFVLDALGERGIRSVLVEGGSTVIWQFVHGHLVDEFYTYVGPLVIGGERTPTVADGKGISGEENPIRLSLLGFERCGDGIVLRYGPV